MSIGLKSKVGTCNGCSQNDAVTKIKYKGRTWYVCLLCWARFYSMGELAYGGAAGPHSSNN